MDVYTMNSKKCMKYSLVDEIQNTRMLGAQTSVRKYGDIAVDQDTWFNAKMYTKEIRLLCCIA